MFPLVGSGKFITAPVITKDGIPTQDPIVLLEANPEKLMTPTAQATGNSFSFFFAVSMLVKMFINVVKLHTYAVGSDSAMSCSKEEDKKIIEWKRTLHQIG